MNLISLKNEVEAAKELLAQAEENYKKGILEAAQNGELAERKTAMWKEVYSAVESKTKSYCDGCGYYSPIKSDFCPKCGAKMTNPSMYVPKQASAWLQEKAEITLSETNKDNVAEKPATTSTMLSSGEWEMKTNAEKQGLVIAECDRLISKYGSATEASKAVGKSKSYVPKIKETIRKHDIVPRYYTYYIIARAK